MMDKLFDGSDAHLLPGNAELIERLRRPFVMSMFANRGDLYEASECERHEAADALEAADKRIAGLKEAASFNFEQYQDAAFRLHEAEHNLAVAREALKNLFLISPTALECNDMHHAKKDQHEYDEDCPVLSRYEDALSGAREALAQTGGDDAS